MLVQSMAGLAYREYIGEAPGNVVLVSEMHFNHVVVSSVTFKTLMRLVTDICL